MSRHNVSFMSIDYESGDAEAYELARNAYHDYLVYLEQGLDQGLNMVGNVARRYAMMTVLKTHTEVGPPETDVLDQTLKLFMDRKQCRLSESHEEASVRAMMNVLDYVKNL